MGKDDTHLKDRKVSFMFKASGRELWAAGRSAEAGFCGFMALNCVLLCWPVPAEENAAVMGCWLTGRPEGYRRFWGLLFIRVILRSIMSHS